MFPRDFVRTQQVSLLLFDMGEMGCSHFVSEANYYWKVKTARYFLLNVMKTYQSVVTEIL